MHLMLQPPRGQTRGIEYAQLPIISPPTLYIVLFCRFDLTYGSHLLISQHKFNFPPSLPKSRLSLSLVCRRAPLLMAIFIHIF